MEGHDEENVHLHNGINDNPPQLSDFRPKEILSDESREPWLSWKEVKMQCFLAGPLILGNLLSFCLQMISLTFVGHFGELELSGASIANSFAVVTGFSIVLGMGCALETLCGQAYGAKQYRKMGIYMQRAIVVLNVTAIPLAFLWANMESILLTLQQDAQIASKAGEYAVWLIPTLFGSATSQPFTKFLQAQSLVAPLSLISLSVLICHVPICWFLVYKSGMGFTGAALANSVSYWIDVLLLALYVRFSKRCVHSRAPLSLEALQDLKGFFKLAIPSAAMICLEWWSYEVLVILSGFLNNPERQTATISVWLGVAYLARCGAGQGAAGPGRRGRPRLQKLMMLNTIGKHKGKGASFPQGKMPKTSCVKWPFEAWILINTWGVNESSVNTESLIFMLPMGLSAAASTRVSNELGAGHPQTARKVVHAAVVLVASEALLVAVILLSIRNVWGRVYSSEKEVIDSVASLMPLLGLSTIFDGLQAVFSGVARGAGWQKAGAIINLGSFYIAGLPTGCVLAFVLHLGGKGLWLGLTLGAFIQLVVFVIITYFTDWENEAKKAAMRVDALSAEEEPLLVSEK